MPTRIIREGILDSRAVNALSEQAEIFYRRLMSVVDDYGRYEADLELLRVKCFGMQLERWPVARVKQVMCEVQNARTDEINADPLVSVYQHGRKKYLQINNFGQRIQAKPRYPAPPDMATSTVDHGDSRKVTVQTETETETKTDAYSESETDAKSSGDSATVEPEGPSVRPSRVVEIPSNTERSEQMRSELQTYMTVSGKPEPKPPDKAIVQKCLLAINGTSMREVHSFLRHLRNEKDQGPYRAKGPRTYAWFPTVLSLHFRDGPAATESPPVQPGSEEARRMIEETDQKLSEFERQCAPST